MIGQLFRGRVFRHNVLGEIVQNGLPALALLFLRMRRLRIKRDTHRDAVCGRHEFDHAGAVAEGIFDRRVAASTDPRAPSPRSNG